MFNLGVLNGPDMGVIQGMIPNTTDPREAFKEFFGQGRAAAKLSELRPALDRMFNTAKEQHGYTMPGDPDYGQAKSAFDAATIRGTNPRAPSYDPARKAAGLPQGATGPQTEPMVTLKLPSGETAQYTRTEAERLLTTRPDLGLTVVPNAPARR
jgi:hypothetical protein